MESKKSLNIFIKIKYIMRLLHTTIIALGFFIVSKILTKKNLDIFLTTNSNILVLIGLLIIIIITWCLSAFYFMVRYGVYEKNKKRIGYNKIEKSTKIMFGYIFGVTLIFILVSVSWFISENLVMLLQNFFVINKSNLVKLGLTIIFIFFLGWLFGKTKDWIKILRKKSRKKKKPNHP